MKIVMTKKNRITIDFILFEIDGKFLIDKSGKINQPGFARSTLNCGDIEKAKKELETRIKYYTEKGYKINNDAIQIIEDVTFDKATWHLNDSFPKDIDESQVYVVTGFFLGWIVLNNLLSDDTKSEIKHGINEFLKNEISSVQLYCDYLDGVFTSSDVNLEGYYFTKNYFEFENGLYLKDYDLTFGVDLPSFFHVLDTKDNFNKICSVIDKRFKEYGGNAPNLIY